MPEVMEWWQSYYDNYYLDIYSYTEKNAPSEVDGILKMLDADPPKKILDLCCGFGRHAIILARMGFEVTGIDLSESILQAARFKADKLHIRLELEKADMRQLNHIEEFDIILNLFTAFGIFNNENDDLLVLQNINRALKPDGHFLIDTINRDCAIHDQEQQSWSIDKGRVILEERQFDLFNSRLEITHHLVDNGNSRKLESSFRLYTLREMLDLFREAGLVLTGIYGDFNRSQYTAESPRMILVARKAS